MLADRPAPMKSVTRVYVDQASGEELILQHEEPVKTKRPRDVRASEPFGLMFMAGIARLARMELSGAEYHVLLDMVGQIGFEAPIIYSPKDMGERLGMHRQAVSRVIRQLRQKNLLIDAGKLTVWIDPNIFWRGSLKARMETLYRLEHDQKIRAADAAEEG